MLSVVGNKYRSHKEVINNFAWRSLQIFSKQGVVFIIFIICAKLLTPYDFGIYNYILTIIFFLIIFGDFGISTATSKYITEYHLSDVDKQRSILFNSTLMILLLTVIITGITLIIGPQYLKDKYIYIIYLLPLIFLSPMSSLYDGIYRGLKKFKQLAVISTITGLLSIIFIFPLIKSYGLTGALLSQNFFYLILLIGLGSGYRDFNFKINKTIIREIGIYSFYYGFAILGNYFFIRFGILILGYYGYIEQIAVYELINKFFTLLLLPFILLGQVVAPDFTTLAIQRKYHRIYSIAIKYTIIFFIAGILLGIFFYFTLPIVFKIFFAEYYYQEYFNIVFMFCLLIYVLNVWAATFDAGILIPTGYASLMAKFYLILGFLSVMLILVLVTNFGFIGVMISFLAFTFLMVVGLRTLYFRKSLSLL